MSRKNQSAADEVAQAERDAEVVKLRIAGMKYADIAAAVGYAGPGSAYKAFQRAMKQTLQEPAEEMRKLERERLDSLFVKAFEIVEQSKGDAAMRALDRCLAIQARRAALDGLDAPTRIEEHVITEDAVDAEIRRLTAQLAERGDIPEEQVV